MSVWREEPNTPFLHGTVGPFALRNSGSFRSAAKNKQGQFLMKSLNCLNVELSVSHYLPTLLTRCYLENKGGNRLQALDDSNPSLVIEIEVVMVSRLPVP